LFWTLAERFKRGEISGLSDDTLSELAAVNYTINPRGLVTIEAKDAIKAALGKSPDLAESLMLAAGQLPPEPYRYEGLLGASRAAMLERAGFVPSMNNQPGGPQRQDAIDDMMGDATFFVRDRQQMLSAGQSERWRRGRYVNRRFYGW
jgi:hypothetical protein